MTAMQQRYVFNALPVSLLPGLQQNVYRVLLVATMVTTTQPLHAPVALWASFHQQAQHLAVIVMLAMRIWTRMPAHPVCSALSASMQQQRRLSAQTVLLDMRMLTVIQLQSASSVRRVRMRRRWPPHVPTVMRASTMTMHRVVAAL